MRLAEIVERLATFGLGYAVLRAGAGGALLLLPEYGRVLGLWAGERAENALWVNPRFLERLAIGAKDDGWTNPGGERMWLAPREEFCAEGGEVPPSIDPGHFTGSQERSGYTMENRGEAHAWQTGTTVRFRMVRRVLPLGDEQMEKRWGRTLLRRAGYEEETLLQCSGACPPGTRLTCFTQAVSRGRVRVTLRGRDGAGVSGVFCIVPAEPGHSQLLAKGSHAIGASHLLDPRWEERGGSFEISCSSPPVGTQRKLAWRTSLCVYSGRTEEIEALAARISG
jgi:hypothetical protein